MLWQSDRGDFVSAIGAVCFGGDVSPYLCHAFSCLVDFYKPCLFSVEIPISRLLPNGNFNLHNIIFNAVNDGFIDAHFIRKSMERQAMLLGI